MRASLRRLQQVDVGTGSAGALTSGLREVKASLAALTASAGNELAPQASALKAALNSLGSDVASLRADLSLSALTSVTTGLDRVAAAGRDLASAAKPHCGS